MLALPSYIKNSTQLIIELEHNCMLPHDCVILAADVESLYPSIDIQDGLLLLRRALNRHNNTTLSVTHKLTQKMIEFILELATWVLHNNYVQFGTNNYYKQIKGTAMGTPFAVTFACIYMGELEQEALIIMQTQNITIFIKYYRYIDDIISFFRTTFSATQYMIIFNSLRPGRIILKLTHIGNSADFLDLTIYKGDRFNTHNIIDFCLFQKPFNKYLYLPTSSFHKQHTFKSFIQSEMKRYRINCNNDNQYISTIQLFATRLFARGYSSNLITDSMSFIPNRQHLLNDYITRTQQKIINKSNNINNKTILVFKTINTPRQVKLKLNNCLAFDDFVWGDPNSIQLFSQKPIISYKRAPNLSDKLTTSAHKYTILKPVSTSTTIIEQNEQFEVDKIVNTENSVNNSIT
jgi:hypothetical protein